MIKASLINFFISSFLISLYFVICFTYCNSDFLWIVVHNFSISFNNFHSLFLLYHLY